MSMDDYDLNYIFPSIVCGLILGLFLSLATTAHISKDNIGEGFGVIGITVLITLSITLFTTVFVSNPKKQALKLNGMLLGGILMIVSIVFFFVDWNYVIVPLLTLLTLLFILTETIYWCDKNEPNKKGNKLLFTAERKGISLLFASLMITVLIGFFNFSKRAYYFLGLKYEIILKWIGYIGIGIFWIVLIAAGIMLYLWLNSLKYKRKK